MNEQQCLQAIKDGSTAYGLVLEHAPELEKKFKRLCNSMEKFLLEAKKTFPDAQYYTAGGGFNLLLGKGHSDDSNLSPQAQLSALSAKGVTIGDGDY